MKSWAYALIGLFLLAASATAEDNILKNGSFNKGRMNWDMGPGMRVIDIPDGAGHSNKVLEVELDKNKLRVLSVNLDTKSKTKALVIAFRIKPQPGYVSAVPEGHQLTVRMHRPGGSTFSSRAIAPTGDWQDVKWNFSDLKNTRGFTFSIEIHPGAGTVLLDDVVIQEL
jgi:hypothetical protein